MPHKWNESEPLPHTKTGIIIGLSSGLILLAMGATFLAMNMLEHKYSGAWSASILIAMGLTGTIVHIIRWMKMRK